MTGTSTASTSWRSLTLRTRTGSVPARLIEPSRPSVGWLVWAHGGSWTRGSVEQWHQACTDLAELSACTVVSVDYRLAPRHRHPAPLNDILTALDWVQAQVDVAERGPAKIAVGGDSAGGTLAACAALTWRDQNRTLDGQVLAYPPLDPTCTAASYGRRPDAFPARIAMISAWQAHRGTTADTGRHPAGPYSTPFEATELTDLAPTVLAVGRHDPVADDVHEYARRLARAQVPVLLREFENTEHGAFLISDTCPDSATHTPALRAWLGSAVRQLFDSPPTVASNTPSAGSTATQSERPS